jgi:hypothetical protein
MGLSSLDPDDAQGDLVARASISDKLAVGLSTPKPIRMPRSCTLHHWSESSRSMITTTTMMIVVLMRVCDSGLKKQIKSTLID